MRRLFFLMTPILAVAVALCLLRAPRGAVFEIAPQRGAGRGVITENGRTMIDLNRADAFLIESVPGIGPVLAGRIEAYIRKTGALKAPEALLDIKGIGKAKLAAIKARAVISP